MHRSNGKGSHARNLTEPDTIREIIITTKGKEPETFLLSKSNLLIGRDTSNNISLNSKAVSRHHANLFFERGAWLVEDLGSTNGSYIDGIRLEANDPTAWEASQPLQIGPFTLELQNENEITGHTMIMSQKELAQLRAEHKRNHYEDATSIILDPAHIEISLQQDDEIQIDIFNNNSALKKFNIKVEGIPNYWYRLSEMSRTILPEGKERITLFLDLPVNVISGQYPFVVVLTDSQNQPSTHRVAGTISVPSVRDFSFEISEEATLENNILKVRLTNTGNTPDAYEVRGQHPDSVKIVGKKWKTVLLAGDTDELWFSTWPEDRPFLDRTKTKDIALIVHSNGTEREQRIDVTVPISPIISRMAMVAGWAGLTIVLAVLYMLR